MKIKVMNPIASTANGVTDLEQYVVVHNYLAISPFFDISHAGLILLTPFHMPLVQPLVF